MPQKLPESLSRGFISAGIFLALNLYLWLRYGLRELANKCIFEFCKNFTSHQKSQKFSKDAKSTLMQGGLLQRVKASSK